MKRLFISIALCAGLVPSLAFAQRAATITGAGLISCGEFIKNRDKPGAPGYFSQWAMGYISAYNFFGAGPNVVPPEESTILLHAEKHCRARPLDQYLNATSALIDDLGGKSEHPTPLRPKK